MRKLAAILLLAATIFIIGRNTRRGNDDDTPKSPKGDLEGGNWWI